MGKGEESCAFVKFNKEYFLLHNTDSCPVLRFTRGFRPASINPSLFNSSGHYYIQEKTSSQTREKVFL